MTKSNFAGVLVAIEGGDGAGKSTVRRQIFKKLEARDITCLSTIPRSYLDVDATRVFTYHKYGGRSFSPALIADAYAKDRCALRDFILRPALEANMVVLLDRYVWSDIAYLESVHGVPLGMVSEAFEAARVLEPDVTVFVSNSPETAIARIQQARGQVHSWEKVEIQKKVLKRMTDLRATAGRRVLEITNEGSELELAAQIDRVTAEIVSLLDARQL